MQVTQKQLNPTSIQLTIKAEGSELEAAKQAVLKEIAAEAKLSGFRKGHAPLAMVEKTVDEQLLQSRVIDATVNDLYSKSLEEQNLRPASQPEVSLSKFVPFTDLELTATFDIIGEVTLPDYKKFKIDPIDDTVTDDDVTKVLDNILSRDAKRDVVKRAAKDGDEVTIDFRGVDAKTTDAIEGAEGKDYALVIGSGTFIPGFEPELVGMKKDDNKSFTVTFPGDYGVTDLQNRKVTFTVEMKEVAARILPKLDDEYAKKLGPFSSVEQLKQDVRAQLAAEKQRQAIEKQNSEILDQLAEQTDVALPNSVVESEIDRMDEEEKRNLVYRGQTWQEHLKAEGKTEEEHREGHREQAILRVKAGIALGEVAQKENIVARPEDFQARLQELRQRYASDQKMLQELDNPDNQLNVLNGLMTEQTLAFLRTTLES